MRPRKDGGEVGEKLVQQVWDLGRYPVESLNRGRTELQLAERLRRALRDKKLSPEHVTELQELDRTVILRSRR